MFCFLFQVLELWSEMPHYTEHLDKNSSSDIKPTRESHVWQLVRDKLPYVTGKYMFTQSMLTRCISNINGITCTR